jgi:hypothetical protein
MQATEVEKTKARSAVNKAVKRGDLKRPVECDECGVEPNPASDGRATIQAHHHKGYEAALDVVWLCPTCHFKYDDRSSGEKNGRAKLSSSDVQEIRSRYQEGAQWCRPEGSAKKLAREYGVSDRTVRRIINNEIWIDAALKEHER